jgi:uncharacterized protein (DUF885 family)
MIKFLELGQKAMDQLGDRYSPKDFHTRVLENGALPLSLLEEQVDAYIKEKS